MKKNNRFGLVALLAAIFAILGPVKAAAMTNITEVVEYAGTVGGYISQGFWALFGVAVTIGVVTLVWRKIKKAGAGA